VSTTMLKTNYYCVCACVDMVSYTDEQHVFLYEMYVKRGSNEEIFAVNVQEQTIPSTIGIHKLTKKVRSTRSLFDKKP
jgi:hypothetical protein